MSVYFVQAGKTGPIKIGWAVDVGARMKILQCGHYEELFLLREISGQRSDESWFHRYFKNKRVRGEWFDYAREMATLLPPKDLPSVVRAPKIPTVTLALFNKCINHLGGAASVANLCNITADGVTKWAKNGIPTKHWPAIVAVPDAEISYEFLANLGRARLEAIGA